MVRRAAIVIGLVLATWMPADAAFHLMRIVEVFPGTAAQPNAQYVVLQMYSAGQNIVGGHSVRIYNAAGAQVGTFTFPGSVPSGANQAKILIATPEAAAFFNVTANLAMTAVIPSAGGAACFDSIDCVAWGNYSATAPSAAGTPVRKCETVGLAPGQAIKRRLDIAGGPTTLEATDDTGNSANDFVFGLPTPRNNAGVDGSVPAATCGNGAVEGLEGCDDGGSASGDGCSATCVLEACGNCTVDPGEDCEPPGVGDCGATCQMLAPPTEVSATGSGEPLIFTAPDTLTWQSGASIGATAFDVYRGSVADLGLADYGLCFEAALQVNTTSDATGPAEGEAVFYLVTGRNEVGQGPSGTDSAGNPRPVTDLCP